MPFERREILFYLAELAPTVLNAGEVINGKMPPADDVQIIDALHTRDFNSSFHNIQDRFRILYTQSGGEEGVMFRLTTKGLFKREEVAGLLVRDRVMENILFKACKEFKIALPRAAKKTVTARDLAIGFELTFDSVNLILQDA